MTAAILLWIGLMVLAGATAVLLLVRLFPDVFGHSRARSIALAASYLAGVAVLVAGAARLLRN